MNSPTNLIDRYSQVNDVLMNCYSAVLLFLLLLWLAYLPRLYQERKQFLKVAFPVSFLSSFVFFFFYYHDMPTNDFLVALMLGVCSGISLLHPAIGLSFFVSHFILRPWEIFENPGMLQLPRATIVVTFLSLFIYMMQSKKIGLIWSKAIWVLIAFLTWIYFSTLFVDNSSAAQTAYFDSVFKSIFVFLLVLNCIQSSQSYSVFTKSIALAGGGLGIIALVFSVITDVKDPSGRLTGTGMLANSNDIAAIILLTFPFSLRPVLTKSKNTINILFAVFISAMTILTVWLTKSRGAILSAAVSFGSFFYLTTKKKIIIVLASIAVAGYFTQGHMLGRESDDLSQSEESRINYWKTGVNMVISNPVFGVGFGQYPKLYEAYAPNLKYEWGERTAHSSWVLIMSETGMPGLILFAVLFSISFVQCIRNYKLYPEIFLSYVGYFAAISFLSHTYLLFPYLIMSICLLPKLITNNENANS